MRTIYTLASSPRAAGQVAFGVLRGLIPELYKSSDECLRAYAAQPDLMQHQYFPVYVLFEDVPGNVHDENEVMAKGTVYRLDAPASTWRN